MDELFVAIFLALGCAAFIEELLSKVVLVTPLSADRRGRGETRRMTPTIHFVELYAQ